MTQTNPYLTRLQAEQAAAIRQTLQTVVDNKPDQEGNNQRLASQYQLPVEAVKLDTETLQRRASLDTVDYQHLVQHLPATSHLLTQPQQAAIAHDDIANLSAMEQALQFAKQSGKALLSGVYGFSEGVAGQAEAGADLLSHYVTAPLAGSVLPVDIAQPVAAAFRQIRQSQSAWRQYLTPPAQGNLASGYYAGLQSLSQNLLTLPLAVATDNPQLALNSMALTTGGQAYGRARDQGLAAPQAAVYGAADAAIEYATEQTPMGLLFKDLKASAPLFKVLTRQIASEIPGEQAATVLQDMNEWAVLHPEQTLDDYLAARPDAALQTLVATVVGTGGQTGLLHGVQALVNRQRSQTDSAEQQALNLQAINHLAAASKVLQRNPQTLQNFVENALAEGAVQHVYIDAEALQAVAAEQPQLASMPEVQQQLPTALAAGGEVSVPIAQYVRQIAPQVYAQRLLDHVRLEGEVFNRADARHYQELHAQQLQAEISDMLHAQHSNNESQLAMQAVKDSVFNQLQQVGRFSEAVHDNYATLLAHFYHVQGQKLGISGEELFRHYPLQIAGPEAEHEQAQDWQQKPLKTDDSLAETPSTSPITDNQLTAKQSESIPDNSPKQTASMVSDDTSADVLQQKPQAGTHQAWQQDPVYTHEPNTEKATGQGRGSFNPATRTITLNENADLSTFLHESAHLFLEMQVDMTWRILDQEAENQSLQDYAASLFQGPRKKSDKADNGELLMYPMSDDEAVSREFDDFYNKHHVYLRTRDDMPPGEFATKTKLMIDGKRLLATDVVKTPAQAAQAMSYMSRFPVERFEALVTNKDGVPLAIVGAFKGTRYLTPAWPETLAAEAFRIEGATDIWFSHNHPGDGNTFSLADRVLNRKLANVFRGSEITAHGFLLIGTKSGSGRYWMFEPTPAEGDEAKALPDIQPNDKHGVTKKPQAIRHVPVLERMMMDESALTKVNIYPPYSTSDAQYIAKKRTGVLLLDAGGRPKAFVPIKSEDVEVLRTAGRLDSWHRVLSMVNPDRAIIVNQGDLTDAAIHNLVGFFTTLSVVVSDVLDIGKKQINSRREANVDFSNKLGFMQAMPGEPLADAGTDSEPDIDADSEQDLSLSSKQQILADTRILLDWFGVESLQAWQQLDFEQKRVYHEKFAESFEAYLFAGKAPNLALQSVFERFRAWLLKIYRSLRSLNSQLTKEVRSVFDRMLASSEEIRLAEQVRAMRPLFKTAKAAGMSAIEFAEYQALQQAANSAANRSLQGKALRDMQWLQNAGRGTLRSLQQRHSGLRRQIRKQMRAQVKDMPVYRAWDILTAKNSDVKLDAKGLAALSLTVEQQAHLSRLGMVAHDAEWPIEAVAEWYDYESAIELVMALLQAEAPNQAIRRLTDQYLLEHYAELGTPQALKSAVQAALHNEVRAKLLAMEADALAIAADDMRVSVDTLQAYARRMLSGLSLGNVRHQHFLHAEASCAADCVQALQEENPLQASRSKRQQLINFYATRQALQLESEIATGLEYSQKFIQGNHKLPIREFMLMSGLLDKFYLSGNNNSFNEVSFAESMTEWLAIQAQLGIQVVLPTRIIAGKGIPYLQMHYDQFTELLDTLKQIEHLAALPQRVLTGNGQHSFKSLVKPMLRSIQQHAETKQNYEPTGLIFLQGYNALATRAAYWVDYLGGGKQQGPVWDYLIRPAIDSAIFENSFRAQTFFKLAGFMEMLLPEDATRAEQFFPHIQRSLNREMCLTIALYTANQGSIQRLLGGEKWQPADLTSILATLHAEDWQIIQQIWDVFADLRPQIAEQQQKILGMAPHWLTPYARSLSVNNRQGQPVEVVLRGGFYPLRYDALGLGSQETPHISTATRLCFINPYDAPVLFGRLGYSLSGMFSGAADIIRDLAWQENILDIQKFGHNDSLMANIMVGFNPRPVVDLLAWVTDLSAVNREVDNAETAMAKFKLSPVMAGLSVKVLNAASNALGFDKVVSELQPKWLASGIGRYLGNPFGSVEFVNDISKFMRYRNGKRLSDLDVLRQRMETQGGSSVTELLADIVMIRARQVAEMCCWLSVYEQTSMQGDVEYDAILAADQKVASLLLGAESDSLWVLARAEPLAGLFKQLYRYASISFTQGKTAHPSEASRAEQVIDYVLQQAVPLVLGQALLSRLPVNGDNIFSLATHAVAQGVEAQLPLLMLTQEFIGRLNTQGGNLDKALSRGEFLHGMGEDTGLSPWLEQLTHYSDFDQALWQQAEKQVAGAEGTKRAFRNTAIKYGWWHLL
ncbi:JAB domain-containing protein [Methylomonas sp. AM2-LC]|uniref:JAB domain-containing protein n=1 Tax=Methylomonas sp. AM2-LC TaxID=3153301 RepID=UPI0032671088